MAISPRGEFMEVKETFWQKIVIEEQAISVLRKAPGKVWMTRRSFGRGAQYIKRKHLGRNFCEGMIRQLQDLRGV